MPLTKEQVRISFAEFDERSIARVLSLLRQEQSRDMSSHPAFLHHIPGLCGKAADLIEAFVADEKERGQ